MRPSSLAAFDRARAVADAVLYEGYVLYPYRASSNKNQVRWQFGVLVPRAFSETDGSEHWSMRTNCVATVRPGAEVDVRVRFLSVVARTVESCRAGRFKPVDTLEVGEQRWVAWDEAEEQDLDLEGLALDTDGGEERLVELPANRTIEELRDTEGVLRGRLVRERLAVTIVVRTRVAAVPGPFSLARIEVVVENATPWADGSATRDEALRRSLVSAHTLLSSDGARFVSMVDPPEFARAAVTGCVNERTWPVLLGEEGCSDAVLSAPIILPDHPEVAPESPGDLCDATEIDEILALRIMTLTDDEKREARGTDARAAAIVDRCDTMPPEIFERLHGAVRSLEGPAARPMQDTEPADGDALPWWEPAVDASFDPWSDTLLVGEVELARGSRVRLCPGRRADAQDMFLAGREATVAGVFADVDGDRHVAVTLDDDDAVDLQQWQGRYRFFHPDEVEPLGADA